MNKVQMNSGVYQILNTINDKCYVGSSVNLQERKTEHFRNLNRGSHHNPHLQRAYKKYGPDVFNWEILEYVDDFNFILTKEQRWILQKNATCRDYGYNICESTTAPMLGRKQTESAKSLIGNANRGRPSPIKGKNAAPGSVLALSNRKGEKHPLSNLTESDVRTIFDLHSQGIKPFDIAESVGSNPSNIRQIIKGKTWKHLGIKVDLETNINNTSGNTGVHYCKSSNRWIAQIQRNRQHKNLGSYLNKEDAIAARKHAEDAWKNSGELPGS